jgi:hypothetical protein
MKIFNSGLFALALLFPFSLSAQCGLMVDAGSDQISCPGVGTVRLNGAVSGANITGFRWTPADGLDDPTSLTPLSTISGLITYTLEAEVFTGDVNLVNNPGFEAGDIGFTSDYVPGTGGDVGLLTLPGEYTITSKPELVNDNFSECLAHGGGEMMVANGAFERGNDVWCQTIAVQPNTSYRFSAWVTSVRDDPDLAQLIVRINGFPQGGPTTVSATTCQWTEMNASWEATNETSIELCLQNLNLVLDGNDFALDDIFFGPVCKQIDEVTIGEVEYDAVVISQATLNCEGTTFLDGFGSSEGPEFTYRWETTNGNIVSGGNTLFPEVDEPGQYVLNIFYDDGTTACPNPSQATVNAVVNTELPMAQTVLLNFLGCTNTTAVISAEGSSTGNLISYRWETSEGNIVSGAEAFQATVDQPGIYFLTVRNERSDCESTAEVDVFVDEALPIVRVANNAGLRCGAPLRLDARATQPNTRVTLSWTTADGNIVSGADGFRPFVDAPGTYELTVVDDLNGCSESSAIVVNDLRPDLTGVTIAPPPAIDCINKEVRLLVEDDSGVANLAFVWTTTGGSIVADATTATPLVNGTGTYYLRITDQDSNCGYQDSVVLTNTAARPVIALQTPQLFTCDRAQMTLDATGSSTGTGFTYQWMAANGGSVVANADSLRPTVAGSGDYLLAVTNDANGCRRDTTFSIGEETTAPGADAGTDFELACGVNSVTLDGSASSTGSDYRYRWETGNGVFAGPVNTLQPAISSAGSYNLIVTDVRNGCRDTSVVVVLADAAAPDITIAAPEVLNCVVGLITLDATGSADAPGLVRNWTTTDGNIVSGMQELMPTVDAPGTYVLTIQNGGGACTSTESVRVLSRTDPPVVEAGAVATITCTTTTVRLAATDPGPGNELTWQTTDGSLLAGVNTATPEAGSTGRYFLFIEEQSTGCVGVDSVEVVTNETLPSLDLGPAQRLITCLETEVTITAGPVANDLAYAWLTTNGQLLQDDVNSITVITRGTYELTVTDTLNGCSATESVTVLRDDALPTVAIAPPATLNCENTELQLDGSASDDGQAFVQTWRTADGFVVSGGEAAIVRVNRTGNYELLVVNQETGCRDSAAVTVTIDTIKPLATIAPPEILTCENDTLTLDGSSSDGTTGFSWTWGTNDGRFASDVLNLAPQVDAAGTYFIVVRNAINGCSSSDTVTVISEQDLPDIRLGAPNPVLDCRNSTVLLGAAAGAEVGVTHRWTTGPGGTTQVGNTPEVTVTEPGTYLLQVVEEASGCTAIGEVVVTEDIRQPEPVIAPAEELNCLILETRLASPPRATGRELRPSVDDGRRQHSNRRYGTGYRRQRSRHLPTIVDQPNQWVPGFYDDRSQPGYR